MVEIVLFVIKELSLFSGLKFTEGYKEFTTVILSEQTES